MMTSSYFDENILITKTIKPLPQNSFWTNVIGRGFPTPINSTFRWCTDCLKINPSADFIRDIIKQEKQEVVVLLGVGKAEGIARKRHIKSRELANRLLNRHETIRNAFVYNPIMELTTEDVWKIDGGKTPWGSDNNDLATLYSEAGGGECPSVGTNAGNQTQYSGNSGFSCWVCTVMKEDKSLNGFIKMGHRELMPLVAFRTWIMSIRDRDEFREKSAGMDPYMKQR